LVLHRILFAAWGAGVRLRRVLCDESAIEMKSLSLRDKALHDLSNPRDCEGNS
jgi:hypothetical protein